MDIDHIHFFVEDTAQYRNYLIEKMGFQRSSHFKDAHTDTEVLKSGSIYFVLSSPLTHDSPVFDYLASHPPGVVDIALRVEAIQPFLAKVEPKNQAIFHHQLPTGNLKWTQISGWGSLNHTLIENTASVSFCDVVFGQGAKQAPEKTLQPTLTHIDHVVLNVPVGMLNQAIDWYRHLFGFQVQQTFNIQTEYSGLKSQVLSLPNSQLYFNINEPTSANSQIQDFLDANRGSGIQHIALHTDHILQAVAQMRRMGQSFLAIPNAYYTQLRQRLAQRLRPLLSSAEIQAVQAQQVLVDWQPEVPDALLLQIFTPPIFAQPTFFLS